MNDASSFAIAMIVAVAAVLGVVLGTEIRGRIEERRAWKLYEEAQAESNQTMRELYNAAHPQDHVESDLEFIRLDYHKINDWLNGGER